MDSQNGFWFMQFKDYLNLGILVATVIAIIRPNCSRSDHTKVRGSARKDS
jgi:hypothetical protein